MVDINKFLVGYNQEKRHDQVYEYHTAFFTYLQFRNERRGVLRSVL